MGRNQSASLLSGLGLGRTFSPVKSLTSAVTTAWGVDWDETYIARDVMQNFFDANRERLGEVAVAVNGPDVSISAPAPLNLERLFYLGSEKGEDDVGQYGEGFKVAAPCLLRDHKVTPVAASGRDVLLLRVADTAVANTDLYPVEYDFFRSDKNVPGTVLLLRGCSPKLTKALSEGLTHFFHEGNPLLGLKRWSHSSGNFSLYDSTDGRGHLFYRNLKRGEIDDIPVVLVIDKKYDVIERKISKDRDRNAFGDEVMKLFYSKFARYGLKGYSAAQRIVVEAAKRCWQQGHPLLREMADTISPWRGSPWPDKMVHEVFGGKYFARCLTREDTERLRYEMLERGWEKEGKQRLPEYFARFGVLNAKRHCEDLEAKALEESKRRHQRGPTTAENEGLRVLRRALGEFAPEIVAVFNKGTTSYTIARTEALLGQLKEGRGYHSREVFLAEDLFVSDFAKALATFLHEHSHIFGHDGSRGFTDALTELLETVIHQRVELDQYESEWVQARKVVERERTKSGKSANGDCVNDWLSGMTEGELRKLLTHVPPVILKRIRKEEQEPAGE